MPKKKFANSERERYSVKKIQGDISYIQGEFQEFSNQEWLDSELIPRLLENFEN